MIRLNKYLSDAGICSRREADRLLESGDITVNGATAQVGMKIEGSEVICVRGKRAGCPTEKVVLAYNKPAGIVCSTKDQGKEKNNIVDAIGFDRRIYPVGRLDKDSSGLILMTNDGELVNKVLRSRYGHEKEYEVRVDREIPDKVLDAIAAGGIPILPDRSTKKCTIKRTGADAFNIVLTEGMNREIRRLCEYFGYSVIFLNRIRFMNIKLDGIRSGEYRLLTDEEIAYLGGRI